MKNSGVNGRHFLTRQHMWKSYVESTEDSKRMFLAFYVSLAEAWRIL